MGSPKLLPWLKMLEPPDADKWSIVLCHALYIIPTFVEKSISKGSASAGLLLLQDVVVVVVALQGRVPVPAAHDGRLLLLGVSGRRRQEGGGGKLSGPRGILTHHRHWLPISGSRGGGGRGLDHHRRRSGGRIV